MSKNPANSILLQWPDFRRTFDIKTEEAGGDGDFFPGRYIFTSLVVSLVPVAGNCLSPSDSVPLAMTRPFSLHSIQLFTAYVVLSLCTAQTHGMTAGGDSPLRTILDDALIVPGAFVHVVTSPLRWEATDVVTAGGVLGATGSSMLLDHEVADLLARNRSAFHDDLAGTLVRYAEEPAAIVIAGMYAGGFLFEDRWLRETAVLTASALLTSGLLTQAGKIAVGRARPHTGLGNTRFEPFTNTSDFRSFPSGHTYVAFTLSAVLAERIDNPFATAGLYSLAVLASASRAYGDHHWFSDLVGTSLYSTIIARSIVRWFEGRENGNMGGFQVNPSQAGVRFVWNF